MKQLETTKFLSTAPSARPLIIMHGLLGSGDNWRSLAKQFSENFHVHCLDARNHGQSFHTASMTYEEMADDLNHYLIANAIHNPIVIGHSMGGKTLMTALSRYPGLITQAIIVDIAPKVYPRFHQSMLDTLLYLDLASFKSRSEIDSALSETISNPGIRQFVLKNMRRNEEGQYQWQCNLQALHNNYPSIMELPELKTCETPCLFIRGEFSEYILKEDDALISRFFTNASLISLPTGHWVHAEKPQDFYQAVINFLTT